MFICRRVDGETRVGIFALCDIRKGKDVTYDYQYVPFTLAVFLLASCTSFFGNIINVGHVLICLVLPFPSDLCYLVVLFI